MDKIMYKGKVLIVDDNEDVLFSLNLLLKPHCEAIRPAQLSCWSIPFWWGNPLWATVDRPGGLSLGWR